VLDVLELVKGKSDGTLAFRRSCAHGVCGSDAMRINGRNHLACKTLVRDVGANITVEPVLGLKVKKDLIVDMDPFFDNYKKMLPYMINESPLPADGRERLQSPEDRARFDETTKCILCAACTTSCPSYWANGDYYGPAAIVTAHRFIFDSRDEAAGERLQILAETDGVARCHTAYNCTEACPREIKITKAIGEVKLAMITGKLD
jgi:succinate dehydrogenase / fumarate reductase iron-sulfur subunit